MKHLLTTLAFFFLFSTGSRALAYRQTQDTVGEAFTITAFHMSPGYGFSSLLNSDGSKAIFAGPHIAAEFDVIFSFQDLNIAMGPFIHSNYTFYKNLKGDSGTAQDMNKNDLMYGIKGFVYPFFIGAGYGNTNTTISQNDGRSISMRGTQLGFTGGLKLFGLGKGWQMGFEGWYKNTTFQKTQNSSLNGNVPMESLELYLMISLNPFFQVL